MTAPTPPLRHVLDERVSELLREAESISESRAALLASEAGSRARRETAEGLNQAVRRLRRADGPEELLATLADAVGPYAAGVALLRIEGQAAKGGRIRGVSAGVAEEFASMEIALAEAAALAGAVETNDPVVTAVAPAETSGKLAALLNLPSDARLSIFPVSARGRVSALLCAWGNVEGAPIELLAQAAGAVWSGFPQPPAEALVTISPAGQDASAAGAPRSTWDSMTAEEQGAHLRAQRFARVQVASMRLRNASEVQRGRTRRDLYDALRKPIDQAREAFRHDYFETCPSMVDYLHLELVRTLANDDPELLGENYPGIMR